MKHYAMLVRNNLMSSLTYRAHFIFQILGSVLAIVIQYFLWQAVYAASPGETINGMRFMDTFVYVSLSTAMVVLVRTWIDWFMNNQIRSGDIVMYLFKPVSHMSWMFFESMGQIAGNLLTITLPTCLVLFLALGAQVVIGWNLLIFAAALIMSVILSFLFDYAIGITCFWTMSIWGISTTKETLILLMSGAIIPLPFYPEALREFLLWLPFAWMYNFPLSMLSNPNMDPAWWLRGLGIQASWLLLMFLGVRAYYNLALRKLTVNGG
jgi:ABC-2 type transport system permease protein